MLEKLEKIVYGQKVFWFGRSGVFRVSEATGRELKLITIVPEYVWENPNSPFYNSFQVPIETLSAIN